MSVGGTSIQSNRTIFVSIWIFFITGIYLRYGPVVGGVVLPSVLVLICLPFMVICAYSGPWKVGRQDVDFIALVGVGVFLMMLWSPGREFLVQKTFGFIQFMAALISLVAFVSMSKKIPAATRDRILFILWVGLVAGSLLEVAGVIKGLSDSFRHAIYPVLYVNDARDVGMVGFPRPKVFTNEPSYVTQMFCIAVNAWYIMKPTQKRFAAVILATMALYLVMASPKLFVSIGLTIFIFASQMKKSDFTVRRVVKMGLGIVLLLLILAPQMYDVFYQRVFLGLTNVNLDRVTSENVRVIFPFVTAYDVLSRSPWVGAGIGGKEVIEHMMTLPIESRLAIGGNGFARSLMFFGAAGTVFLFSCFIAYIRRIDITARWSIGAAFGAVFVMGGGLETIFSWGFIAIFMSACLPPDGSAQE